MYPASIVKFRPESRIKLHLPDSSGKRVQTGGDFGDWGWESSKAKNAIDIAVYKI